MIIINDILENNFFISKKSKPTNIEELCLELDIDQSEASLIYDTAINIIKEEVKKALHI